jgi:hypothetical protein
MRDLAFQHHKKKNFSAMPRNDKFSHSLVLEMTDQILCKRSNLVRSTKSPDRVRVRRRGRLGVSLSRSEDTGK